MENEWINKGGRTTFRLNFIKVVLPPCIFPTLLKVNFVLT